MERKQEEKMKFEILEVIDNPFYFGIGGMGDFFFY